MSKAMSHPVINRPLEISNFKELSLRAYQICSAIVARWHRSAEFILHQVEIVNQTRNKFRAPESNELRTLSRASGYWGFQSILIAGILVVTLGISALSTQARINVVNLPGRDSVQLTIYNSADLTLVKETRYLTLRRGLNRLEFSWANTLIDPTSVEFRPLAHVDE